MALTTPARLRDDLAALAQHSDDVEGSSFGAARLLERTVPFDAFCMVTVDPFTQLPTGAVGEHLLPPAARTRLAEIEVGGEDFNSFGALAQGPRRTASLSAATDGDLSRSRRHRELNQPNGFGDELRVALRHGTTMWGGLTLHRAHDQRPFTTDDVELLEAVCGHLAEGLRRAVLLRVLSTEPGVVGGSAGHVALRPDNVIAHADKVARRWLDELRDGDEQSLPPVVIAVAARARAIMRRGAESTIARVRIPTPSRTWLQVSGSTVGPDALTAVILEPAPSHDLAPLVAEAYGLTTRERDIVRQVALGLATTTIARRLRISHWTVQDHLKSAFTKVGVGTRGELVARIYLTPDPPPLHNRRVGYS